LVEAEQAMARHRSPETVVACEAAQRAFDQAQATFDVALGSYWQIEAEQGLRTPSG
jgi:hypothetical protein